MARRRRLVWPGLDDDRGGRVQPTGGQGAAALDRSPADREPGGGVARCKPIVASAGQVLGVEQLAHPAGEHIVGWQAQTQRGGALMEAVEVLAPLDRDTTPNA